MSILEKIKNGFNRFWNEDLGPDIDDENENDFPEDVKDELMTSKNGRVSDLEKAQEQLWEEKPTKRSQLAEKLAVHEDGSIKGNTIKGQTINTEKTVKELKKNIKKQNAATETTRGRKPKQVDDSEIIH